MKRYLLTIAIGVVFAVALGSCREAKIQSGSMEPTIKAGEAVTINYTAYVSDAPVRWDVVAFMNDQTKGKVWCHRVVGLPGETIDIKDSFIFINGAKMTYPQKIAGIRYAAMVPGEPAKLQLPYTIPANTYFVLGDNTNDAYDSRYIGPVKRDDIRGRVEGK
ncbi:MAG: signal peptidase I [Bacteroidetes bacterium]|nr:signal peptidase I [Bacteroidota bacterium]